MSSRRTLGQIEPRIPFDTVPIAIIQSGSYYLARNLEHSVSGQPVISITASNVTLDFMGHTLSSVPQLEEADAVSIADAVANVLVRNGRIVGQTAVTVSGTAPSRTWSTSPAGFSHGVRATETTGAVTVENLTFTGCRQHGVELLGLAGAIAGCRARSNGGSGFRVGDGTRVERSSSELNAGIGFVAFISGLFRDCVAVNNGASGFGASGGAVVDSVAKLNNEAGFLVNSTTIENCQSQSNGGAGIFGDRNTIRGCVTLFNGANGIDAFDSTIIGCTSRNNTGVGILTQRSTVSQCLTGANAGAVGINAQHSVVSFCRATDGAITTGSVLTGNSL